MSAMDIALLLKRLFEMNGADLVVLKNTQDNQSVKVAGIHDKLSFSEEACNNLINFFAGIVLREAGAKAAEEWENGAQAFFKAHRGLTADYCRNMLRRYALNTHTSAALEKFVGQMPEEMASSLKFDALLPHCQVAVMHGVQKGLEMMKAVDGLYEIDDGLLKSDASFLSVATIQKAQKILAAAIKKWVAAVTNALPEHSRGKELPKVKRIIFKILALAHKEASERLLETLTTGPIGDIFTLQGAAVRSFTELAKTVSLPAGIDAKGPEHVQHVFREFLFVVACGLIKEQKESDDAAMVSAEAEALLRDDVRSAMARLLTLYLNGLLRELPEEKDLRQKTNVKGFDVKGIHTDFVRDCIINRDFFSIEGFGKVANSLDRESAVARGRRDLEFYGQQIEEMISKGKERETKKWKPPEVRTSASLSEDDLKMAQRSLMRGIPARGMRMAVTLIANRTSLALFEAFYGQEPATGVNFASDAKQMFITFASRGEFSIVAELHNSHIESIESHGGGDDTMEIYWPNFFCLEYAGRLIQEADPSRPSGKCWQVRAVNVGVLAARLTPPVC